MLLTITYFWLSGVPMTVVSEMLRVTTKSMVNLCFLFTVVFRKVLFDASTLFEWCISSNCYDFNPYLH